MEETKQATNQKSEDPVKIVLYSLNYIAYLFTHFLTAVYIHPPLMIEQMIFVSTFAKEAALGLELTVRHQGNLLWKLHLDERLLN